MKKPRPTSQDILIPGPLAKCPPGPPRQRGKGILCHWPRNNHPHPTGFSKLPLLSSSRAAHSFRRCSPCHQLHALAHAGLLAGSFTMLGYHCKARPELFLTTACRATVPTLHARHPGGHRASVTPSQGPQYQLLFPFCRQRSPRGPVNHLSK